jgi:hypothetical protein
MASPAKTTTYHMNGRLSQGDVTRTTTRTELHAHHDIYEHMITDDNWYRGNGNYITIRTVPAHIITTSTLGTGKE